MKYTAEQQDLFGHIVSTMKGATLRLRPLTSAFVGTGERRHVPVMHEKPAWPWSVEKGNAWQKSEKRFNFGSLLRLRTFAIIIIGTVLLVFYINNLLTINSLSMENERLRENIAVSKSINAALELELQEVLAIDNISKKAGEIGLKARIEPAVIIGSE